MRTVLQKSTDSNNIIFLDNIHKSYSHGGGHLSVLNGINLKVMPGEMISIMGSSGSGKSTLLNILGLLDDHDQGEYQLGGRTIHGIEEMEAAGLRNRHLGFVFQSFHLIPYKTALDNVALPLFYRKVSKKQRNRQAMNCLSAMGLYDLRERFPNELSGGQKQRVAIARAMVGEPDIILADEPTGALDYATSLDVMERLRRLNQWGVTLIVITHDKEIADLSNRVLFLHDGKLHCKA